jgi:hypothetical protein
VLSFLIGARLAERLPEALPDVAIVHRAALPFQTEKCSIIAHFVTTKPCLTTKML